MLTKLGLRTDMANNGAEAVAMVEARDYDLVLMDCQMPVMDGYEATAAIRQLPGEARAAAAHHRADRQRHAGGRNKCLAAGMDDFLAKPYNLRQLRESWRAG